MANWTQMRARLYELESAVRSGDVAGQLRAGGGLAVLVADVSQEPSTRRDGRRDQGDVLGGDCYRSCDVILDLLTLSPPATTPAGVPWTGSWVRELLSYLKSLLKL